MRAILATLLLACLPISTYGALNFVSPDGSASPEVLKALEDARTARSTYWLGYNLPDWPAPCRVTVKITDTPEGSASRFSVGDGYVGNFRMALEGPLDKLIEDVIPHEVDHVVRASITKRRCIRWLDEGLAILAEAGDDGSKYEKSLKGTPVDDVWSYIDDADYPSEGLLKVYGFGHSLTRYLLEKHGKEKLLRLSRCSADDLKANWSAILGERPEQTKQEWLTWYRQSPTDKPVFKVLTASWCGSCIALHNEYNQQRNHLAFQVVFITYNQQIHGRQSLPTAIAPNGARYVGCDMDGLIKWYNMYNRFKTRAAPVNSTPTPVNVAPIRVPAPPAPSRSSDIPDVDKTARIYELERQMKELRSQVSKLSSVKGDTGPQGLMGPAGPKGDIGSFSGDFEVYTKDSSGTEHIIQRGTVKKGEPLRIFLPPIGVEMLDTVVDDLSKPAGERRVVSENTIASEVYGRHQPVRLRFLRTAPQKTVIGE